jgi:glycosyltransferase involved in cell wall biosynthesis
VFVRISFATTKWIAFLDDDDIISNDYIETFYKELEENNNIDLDVIIFRMKLEDRIVPKIETDNFYLCDVGISFIIKKEIYDDGIKFVADGAEDFLYLDNIRQNNYKIMISPYVKYFVRATTYDQSNTAVGNRLFINIENQRINILGYLLYYYYKEGIYD